MTVQELIEKLSQFPQDVEVAITVDWTVGVNIVEFHSADSHINHDYVELSWILNTIKAL